MTIDIRKMTPKEKLILATQILNALKKDAPLFGKAAQLDIEKADRDLRWIVWELEAGVSSRPYRENE